jgi:hypothetical protein
VTLGRQLRRPDLPATGARWCEAALPEGSVYRFLAQERARLFPAELFADLFESTGRRSVSQNAYNLSENTGHLVVRR